MAVTFSNRNYITVDNTWTNLTVTTICFWVYFNTFNSSINRLIGSDDTWGVVATNQWGGAWHFANELFSGIVTSPPPALSVTVPVIETWYHVAASVDATKFGQIWVNGVMEASGTSADTATGTKLALGNTYGFTGACANGILDDIKIYSRVLNNDEVQTIYACRGSDAIYYGLQNRWLLNEGVSGTQLTGSGTVKDMVSSYTASPTRTGGPSNPSYADKFLKYYRII